MAAITLVAIFPISRFFFFAISFPLLKFNSTYVIAYFYFFCKELKNNSSSI
uniref:Uncharacterized protein n=1 Tax=Siphoviridae sp. ctES717 TaxID=2827564 RepID=A0A8S5RSM6_9CAUD|nr:MAG TPA: hypothetical protein [Siphoviridae sp. ctES717]